jgi:hypothetical protein
MCSSLRKSSPVIRKTWDFTRSASKTFGRAFAAPEDYRRKPPILGNSFPKSGTHLMLQVLEAFPGARHHGDFLASTPSFTFRERSRETHLEKIRRMVPAELVGGHLFFDEEYALALRRLHVVHFFIYRDLRDVAVSEMHYLTRMNRWHRMHDYYANQLKSDEDRLITSIVGVRDPDFPYDYPDIGSRMRRYLPWLGRADVFALKYENLNSEHRELTIEAMVEFFARSLDRPIDQERIVSEAVKRLVPEHSHTFRRGRSGSWMDSFSPAHVAAFDKVAGELNEALGYARATLRPSSASIGNQALEITKNMVVAK